MMNINTKFGQSVVLIDALTHVALTPTRRAEGSLMFAQAMAMSEAWALIADIQHS